MKKRGYSDAAGKLVWDMACRNFEKKFPEKEAALWLAGLELNEISETEVSVLKSGSQEKEENLAAYTKAMEEALSWAAGRPLKLVMQQKEEPKKQHSLSFGKKTARGVAALFAVLCFAVILAVGWGQYVNRSFVKQFYRVVSQKVESNFRIVQLSSLQGHSYGAEQTDLLESVGSLAPDLIVVTGDLAGSDVSDAAQFCGRLADIADTFYVFGEEDGNRAELEPALEKAGVTVLEDSSTTVQVGNNTVELYGTAPADSSAGEWPASVSFQDFSGQRTESLKIMISSELYVYSGTLPEPLPDLMLSGHSLDGMIDLPLVGVLYEKRYGFLPERSGEVYQGGSYETDGSTLIVSDGLAERNVMQLGNRPELVIVDVSRY